MPLRGTGDGTGNADSVLRRRTAALAGAHARGRRGTPSAPSRRDPTSTKTGRIHLRTAFGCRRLRAHRRTGTGRAARSLRSHTPRPDMAGSGPRAGAAGVTRNRGRVAILGGGLAGLSSAWRLSEAGWRDRFDSI